MRAVIPATPVVSLLAIKPLACTAADAHWLYARHAFGNSCFPTALFYVPNRFMESTSHEPEAADAESDGLPSVTSTCHGWTPFARKLFLEVLAETGRVSTACDYTRLTRQSAYALRVRDPVFAASWDAACELARQPLADALYERAVDGVTDTITKDGEVVAERHRFDSRLSIAVLHRLDKRCDRAVERGSKHLALVARWDEWLALIGKGAEQEAAALLEPPQHCQMCQNPQSENPTALDSEEEEIDLSDRFWLDEDSDERVWMTDFPPPAGFTGYQNCDYGDPKRTYKRECTPDEVAVLEADAARSRAAERAHEEALRDEWLALLRAECSAADAENRRSSTKSRAEPASGSPRTRSGANPTDVTEGAESNSPELRERPSVTLLRAESGETPPPATTHVDDVPQQV